MAGATKSQYQRDAERTRAAEGGSSSVSADPGAEERQAAAKVAEKATGFTASKVGAKDSIDSGFPKQNPGEDAAAYGSRVRAYREKKQAAIK